jgi:hypothetical protein
LELLGLLVCVYYQEIKKMKLDNPFSTDTRVLFMDHYQCAWCGRSDQGIQLHHITGRGSSSPFNCFPICMVCHEKMCHSQEEEQKCFAYTFKLLYNQGYKPQREDYIFLAEQHDRLFTEELKLWLNKQV